MELYSDEKGYVRALTTRVVLQALNDPTFRNQLKGDPRGTLIAQGLSPGLADDLSQELSVDGSTVAGLAPRCWWTCIWSCKHTSQ